MIKDLVSVLTPCYNGEKHINRLFDSILKQDYSSIEMIVVNDGSTDRTIEIIEKYIPLFNKKGYLLQYINQENQGQSVAIKNGLKYVKGEFLVWPDSDDFYHQTNAISLLVSNLKNLDDTYTLVRGRLQYVDYVSLRTHNITPYICKTDLFEDCLYNQNNMYYGAGCYMAKMCHVKKLVNDIYTEKLAGQNWQLLLPLMYSNKCHTIDKIIYSVTENPMSHCRKKRTYTNLIEHISMYEHTRIETLNRILTIPTDIKNKYIKNVQIIATIDKLLISYGHYKVNEFVKYYDLLKKDKAITLKINVYNFIIQHYWIYKLLRKIR